MIVAAALLVPILLTVGCTQRVIERREYANPMHDIQMKADAPSMQSGQRNRSTRTRTVPDRVPWGATK